MAEQPTHARPLTSLRMLWTGSSTFISTIEHLGGIGLAWKFYGRLARQLFSPPQPRIIKIDPSCTCCTCDFQRRYPDVTRKACLNLEKPYGLIHHFDLAKVNLLRNFTRAAFTCVHVFGGVYDEKHWRSSQIWLKHVYSAAELGGFLFGAIVVKAGIQMLCGPSTVDIGGKVVEVWQTVERAYTSCVVGVFAATQAWKATDGSSL